MCLPYVSLRSSLGRLIYTTFEGIFGNFFNECSVFMKNGPHHCDIINAEKLCISFVFAGWIVIKVFTKPEDMLQQQINAGLYLEVLPN